jgi:hypothetical protein
VESDSHLSRLGEEELVLELELHLLEERALLSCEPRGGGETSSPTPRSGEIRTTHREARIRR